MSCPCHTSSPSVVGPRGRGRPCPSVRRIKRSVDTSCDHRVLSPLRPSGVGPGGPSRVSAAMSVGKEEVWRRHILSLPCVMAIVAVNCGV